MEKFSQTMTRIYKIYSLKHIIYIKKKKNIYSENEFPLKKYQLKMILRGKKLVTKSFEVHRLLIFKIVVKMNIEMINKHFATDFLKENIHIYIK